MRKDHPLAQKEAICSSDLLGIPLISSRQLMDENGMSGWLGYSYEKLHIVAAGNLVNNLRRLAEEGVGCVITLDGIINLSGDCPLCFRPLTPKLESWMYLAWKKYQVFSPAAEVFLHALQNLSPEI